MTVAVTSSVRLRTNDARARSKRPSRLGEKNGVALSSCTRGGVLLSSCAAKNAANVAQTSSANAVRASALTRCSRRPVERPARLVFPCRTSRTSFEEAGATLLAG